MVEKILVIDDEPDMLGLIQRCLEPAGYEVITALDGQSGMQCLRESQPNLVILDIMMPKMDGWEVCRLIRTVSAVPIIMLTALDLRENIVQGLNMGADDYVVKPFYLKELQARVEALLRRISMPPPADRLPLRFDDGDLVIDPINRQVFVRKKVVYLTRTEYNLLLFMAKHADHILSPDLIFDKVWPYSVNSSPNSVKWYIWRLRKKIEDDPRHPRFIVTEKGVGYRFVKL